MTEAANSEFWSTGVELARLLDGVTRALHSREVAAGPLTAGTVLRLARLADHAMSINFNDTAGGDAVMRAVSKAPEPHHLAAFSLAREVAAHVGDYVGNPFTNDRLRLVFAREAVFLRAGGC